MKLLNNITEKLNLIQEELDIDRDGDINPSFVEELEIDIETLLNKIMDYEKLVEEQL